MKKIISALLIISSLALALVSCGKDEVTYDPIPSTEEEARVVMTLGFGDRTYDVKYELYRALFLNLKDEVSGGDDSVWTGESKDEYIDRINSLIISRITHIYSVFALCDRLGVDLYSDAVDSEVKSYIKASVEGSSTLAGHGSYDKYLESLKEMNLNYSVQDLLLRYSIGLSRIDRLYTGSFDPDAIKEEISFGDKTFTKDDIRDYYFSDKCIRTLRAEINPDAHYEPEKRAESIRSSMLDAAATGGEDAVALVIIGSSAAAASEVENGYVLGRYSLDRLYFKELIDASFELDISEVSQPIRVHNESESTIYIVYRADKSNSHFEDNYAEIVAVFLSDALGEMIYTVEEELMKNVSYTNVYGELVHSEISMG